MPALFISGTDTGVGKSVVTAQLTRAMRQMGADCVAMKPLASGCTLSDGALQSEDADLLQAVGGFSLPPELVCPIRLELPLAPLVAAELEGTDTRAFPALVLAAYEELRRRHEWVIVEGVGGWCVPLWRRGDGTIAECADLVALLGAPVVVVARRTLGTVNHTTLTCRAVRGSAELLGVVFCDAAPVETEDVAAATSPAMACELAGVRALGFVPYAPESGELAGFATLAGELLQKSQQKAPAIKSRAP